MRIKKIFAAILIAGSFLLPTNALAQFNWPYKIVNGKAVTEVPTRTAGEQSVLNTKDEGCTGSLRWTWYAWSRCR